MTNVIRNQSLPFKRYICRGAGLLLAWVDFTDEGECQYHFAIVSIDDLKSDCVGAIQEVSMIANYLREREAFEILSGLAQGMGMDMAPWDLEDCGYILDRSIQDQNAGMPF